MAWDPSNVVMEFAIPGGMINQVKRHGLRPKKTGLPGLRGTQLRAHFNKSSDRDERSHTPDGSIIIPREEGDHHHPGTCKAFIHPPYGLKREYRSPHGLDYSTRIKLSTLSKGSEDCSFCSILYRGIYKNHPLWIVQWACHRWNDIDAEDANAVSQIQMPWLEKYWDEIQGKKSINEDEVYVAIRFLKGRPYLGVDLLLEPRIVSEDTRFLSIVSLEFYTAPECPSVWNAFGSAPHTHSNILSMDSIQQMQEWIQDCRDNHLECNVGTTSELPSRLLKLSWPGAGAPSIKLEQTEPSKGYRYVALSHCWNFTNPLRTTKENQAEHLISVPWDELSEALQDSVVTALALNYTYMWIDSLCIIQNDAADWEKEAPRMGMIYNNANVVFAAHGAELFVQKRKPESILDLHRLESPPIFCRQKMDHKTFFITSEDTHSWFGRAWCMQERIFAKRILHFGGPYEKDKEVVFECNTHVKCECSRIIEELEPTGAYKHTLKADAAIIVSNEDINSITARNLAWRSYISSCEDYTARGLTYVSDTLPALSSLMKTFAPYLGKYYAGIWQHNLLLSLQWEALDTGASSRGEKYVAPTFSWASRSGAVIWYLGSAEDLTPESQMFPAILDADCTLAGEDPFGQVSGGYIKLRGYITEMKIESKRMCSPDGRLEMTKEGTESCYVTLDSIQDVENLQVGASVVCLDIMRDRAEGKRYVSGLVVLPVASQNGCYRRIGFSTMLEEHFEDSSTQEVIIV